MARRFGRYPVLLGGLLLLLGGCASTAPTRFYILTALPSSARLQPLPGDRRDIVIGVGPVELPRYLDRPQIAARMGRHELRFAEFDQWAEPLQDNVTRVLAENLSLLLATDYVVTHPWPRSAALTFQVLVRITRFEGTMGERGVLTAQWQIVDSQKRERMRKTSSFTLPVETADYRVLVAALSRALGDLSRDMAVALRALAQSEATR